jgi:hypothetical protein
VIYATLADLTLALHLAFILFVVLGALIVARWPRTVWLHLPAAIWGVAIELAGWICPLTPLENALRSRAGEQGFSGSFVGHYLLPIIYPTGLTRDVQYVLAGCIVVVNLLIYAFVARRPGRRA